MAQAQSNETDIIALLDREFRAFYDKDFAAISECWLHSPSTCRWGWSTRGGPVARRGWDSIGARLKQLMSANPGAQDNRIRRENLDIRIIGDVAWVTFDQHGDDTGVFHMDMPGLSHEMRVLERHEGRWKIAFLLFINRVHEERGTPRFGVDNHGRVLWANQEARDVHAEALGIEIVDDHLRALDRGTDRRLRAALKWAAGIDALDGRTSSLPVVSDVGDRTRIWWVLAESGAIQLAFGDTGISDERLSAAAVIYGITRTQQKLAREILSGRDLVQAAERMGITSSTARTHLQRMFDKVGVRTQPSLVRALLSCAEPR